MIDESKMLPDEIEALRLSRYFSHLMTKIFPSYPPIRLPQKGDPRKSVLFKYCYKLLQETKNRLDPENRKLFIAAQFAMFKNITLPDGNHPLITPSMLVSEKAWVRWVIWKKKYDDMMKKRGVAKKVYTENDAVKKALISSRKFLKVALEKISKESIAESISDERMFRWCVLGRVSFYFLVLSPAVQKYLATNNLNIFDKYGIDLSLYENSPDLVSIFLETFSEEKDS